MRINISHEAELIANGLQYQPGLLWDDIRDFADRHTFGDLDCFQLDMLTNTVVRVIERESRQRWTR